MSDSSRNVREQNFKAGDTVIVRGGYDNRIMAVAEVERTTKMYAFVGVTRYRIDNGQQPNSEYNSRSIRLASESEARAANEVIHLVNMRSRLSRLDWGSVKDEALVAIYRATFEATGVRDE